MADIEVSVVIAAPIERVWEEVADLASHVEWMADAESITFLGDQTSGVGTRMEVLTRVGPLSTTDVMEFTAWEPPHQMAIRHDGLVTGIGAFTLSEVSGDRTRFAWRERLAFPWYLGGPVAGIFAAPVLRWIWRRNLRRLAERFASPAAGERSPE